MAGVPGRKRVLWLSAAFPLGRFAGAGGLDAGPFYQEREFLPLVSRTLNLLASAHVSVYPVDVRGVATNPILDISEAAPLAPNLPNSPLTGPSGGQQTQGGGNIGGAASATNMANDHAVSPPGFSQRILESSTQLNSEHTAMDLVAEQTGGKAFYGSNEIADAVRAVVELGSGYYTLSYTPTNRTYDGRFRKIRVSTAEHSYRVAHRSGYYADDPNRLPAKAEAVLSGMNAAGMMHGTPESRQIAFKVQIVPVGEPTTESAEETGMLKAGEIAPATVKMQHYSVDFAISPARLRFDPGPEGKFHGRFRLLAHSFDNEGRALLESSSTVLADLQPGNYRGMFSAGLRLRQEFDVPVSASFLRLGVADMSNNSIGTLELPLPIAVPNP
jgi:hypothetical protein